jgi:lipid II:glycine glycyltransferase (peptidoglycan interpeptide bridge formation enzyme)
LEKPFSRAAADVQPPDSVVIDLDRPAEAVLEGMKPKGRYNIRLAARKGVAARLADESELPVFYRLFGETARRDGIAIHSLEYYRTLFSLSREYRSAADGAGRNAPDVRLYIAGEGGEDLAAIITLFRGKQAVYLYGASSDSRRNLMAPYALQWKAIQDARAAGCREYDLFGIPPRDDPEHPMAGLYRFKTNFGGKLIHRCGSWDYPYRPVVKNLFNALEGIRKQLRSVKKR